MCRICSCTWVFHNDTVCEGRLNGGEHNPHLYWHILLLGLMVSKGSCLNQISGFEPENDTKSIVSIIGPQNVGPLEPHFYPDM